MNAIDLSPLDNPKVKPIKAILSFGQVKDFKKQGLGFRVLPDCTEHRRQLSDEEYLFTQTSRFMLDIGKLLTDMVVEYEIYGGTHLHEDSLVIEPVRYVLGENLAEEDIDRMRLVGKVAVRLLELSVPREPEFVDLTDTLDNGFHGFTKQKSNGG